tara:strand:- start:95 stop:307 length:213 start_codon:yes stop_codon:yes gene_type:complete
MVKTEIDARNSRVVRRAIVTIFLRDGQRILTDIDESIDTGCPGSHCCYDLRVVKKIPKKPLRTARADTLS